MIFRNKLRQEFLWSLMSNHQITTDSLEIFPQAIYCFYLKSSSVQSALSSVKLGLRRVLFVNPIVKTEHRYDFLGLIFSDLLLHSPEYDVIIM